jgi:SAM-dependent methyltransferase
MKPYSEACDQNREPILEVIRPLFATTRLVLEIGSGTGQHAVYFARHLPRLTWVPSDRAQYLPGIRAWIDEASPTNLRLPLELDVGSGAWPLEEPVDGVFSANTTHIMHWPEVETLFALVGTHLAPGGRFALYGPFNYGNHFTSPSNARFDAWLKSRDPDRGIRNFEDLQCIAETAGLTLEQDYAMPANNRILCWHKPAPKRSLGAIRPRCAH